MKKYLLVSVFLLLTAIVVSYNVNFLAASPTAECYYGLTGSDYSSVMSTEFTFICNTHTTVYFGVCDPADMNDLYNIVFKGTVVADNLIDENLSQTIRIGSSVASAGFNSATMNTLFAPEAISTYSFVVSSDRNEVTSYLSASCLGDIVTLSSVQGKGGTCNEIVNIFSVDTAPTSGTLEFHLLFGNESSRQDEQIMMTKKITAGQQLNNLPVFNLMAPRYARVWWQPDGSSTWYLLPSQYWHNRDSLADEYGVSCGGGQPSYHTAFSGAIPESEVCLNLKNDCN